MRTISTAVALAAALTVAAPAAAQERRPGGPPPAVTLQPADPARWDAAFLFGWAGLNRSAVAPEWDDWSQSGSFEAAAGHYLTPHLKLEVGAAVLTKGRVFSQEPIEVPGQPFASFISRQHTFRTAMASAGVSYQLFENTWFHPFVGGGVEAGRDRLRTEIPLQFVPIRQPDIPPHLIPGRVEESASWFARPYVAAGFKWYVAERAFIRSDMRMSVSADAVESAVWRAGIGFDF